MSVSPTTSYLTPHASTACLLLCHLPYSSYCRLSSRARFSSSTFKVVATCICLCLCIRHISYSSMHSLWPSIQPTADASTLLLPRPFKCRHTPDGSCSLPSSRFPPPRRWLPAHCCASSSLPLPLFLLCLSLCHSVIQSDKQREFLRGTGNPQLQTERCTDRSSTADEAHRSSWLNDLWKSCGEANVARLVSSTTAHRQAELRVTSSELTAAKLRVSNLPPTHTPPSLLLLFCLHTLLSSLTVTTFHLIAESSHLLCTLRQISVGNLLPFTGGVQ